MTVDHIRLSDHAAVEFHRGDDGQVMRAFVFKRAMFLTLTGEELQRLLEEAQPTTAEEL